MSCGFRRPVATFARIVGDGGELRLSDPFHPGRLDTVELLSPGARTVETPTRHDRSFTAALAHVHRAIRGEEPPRHLAVREALGNAQAVEWLAASAASGVARP